MDRHSTRDEGSVTLEIVIAFPVALLAVLLAINAALWYHARDVALAAAQEGVRAGRAYRADPRTAGATALRFARTSGNGFLLAPAAETSAGSTTLAVRVHGESVSLIPGLHLTVDQVARGPVERFTTPTDDPGSGAPR